MSGVYTTDEGQVFGILRKENNFPFIFGEARDPKKHCSQQYAS